MGSDIEDRLLELEKEREKQLGMYNNRKKLNPEYFCRRTVGIISGLSCKITIAKNKHNKGLKIGATTDNINDSIVETRIRLGLEV